MSATIAKTPDEAAPDFIAGKVALRIMATTDLHMHLIPFDYFNDRPTRDFGLTRVAALIAEARGEAGQCLLFDNGDFLQGSAMGDYLARERTRLPHPMMTAFLQLGYDAGTLGNHEFNYGLPFLRRVLSEARHPVVSANVLLRRAADHAQDRHLVQPFAILPRLLRDDLGQLHAFRIGVIGFTPPQIVRWDRQHLAGKVEVRGIVESARLIVPGMRRLGADLIVALAHTGIAPLSQTPDMNEDCAADLAMVDGIDAIIAGHSHLTFPGPDHGRSAGIDPVAGTLGNKPAVLPGQFGSHLGLIDLVMQRAATGRWKVVQSKSALRATANQGAGRPTPLIAETVRQLEDSVIEVHRATRRWIRRDIGQTQVPLHSYFALIADSMTLGILAAAQSAHVKAALEGTAHAGLPILSAVAPFKAGGRSGPDNYVDIPAGPLALRHAADLCPFPNTVSALKLSGAALVEWLERSVSIYHRIAPGAQDTPLIDDGFASFQHDRIYGLEYEIDLSSAPRYAANGTQRLRTSRRIRKLACQGRPVRPGDAFVLATNSFRSGGAGYFVPDSATNRIVETRLLCRDLLVRHIMTTGAIAAPPPQTWRFAPMPGTTAIFETAPAAIGFLDQAGPLTLVPRGVGENGFLRVGVHF